MSFFGCQEADFSQQLSDQQVHAYLDEFGVDSRQLIGREQLVFVATKTQESQTGRCYLYERDSKHWKQVASFPIVVGKSGFRLGRGLHKLSNTVFKQEGDGAAPSGVFEFGTAFGIDPVGGKWPYRVLNEDDRFVDDRNSRFYNQWTVYREGHGEWESAETMLRKDGLYNQGLVVKHNMNPVVSGAGSAIFFHLWRSSSSPTLGCTAMSEKNMKKVLRWLDPDKKPLLVQGNLSLKL